MPPEAVLDKPAPAAPAATPSPSPAAPSLPAAGGTPAAAPDPSTPTAAGDDNPYADIDAAFKRADEPKPSTKGKAPEPKPTTKEAPAKPFPTAADKAPGVPKELRAELDRVKGELKTKTDSHAALEAKIADYEKRGKDTTALTTQLEAERKEKEELKAQLRRAKKEVDPDFVKQYETPYQDMVGEAQGVIPTIEIPDAETGAVRKGSWDDFVKLYGYNEFLANKEAKKLFGDDGAPVAMRYYMELHRLDKIKKKALNEVQAKWKEDEQAEKAKEAEARVNEEKKQQDIDDFYNKTGADLAEKIEDYHDSPDDKELVDARKKALDAYDAPTKTLKERIIKDAHNRLRVGAFLPHKLLIARLKKENEELKAENEGLKEKPPGATRRPGGAPGAKPEKSFEDGLREHMNQTA